MKILAFELLHVSHFKFQDDNFTFRAQQIILTDSIDILKMILILKSKPSWWCGCMSIRWKFLTKLFSFFFCWCYENWNIMSEKMAKKTNWKNQKIFQRVENGSIFFFLERAWKANRAAQKGEGRTIFIVFLFLFFLVDRLRLIKKGPRVWWRMPAFIAIAL